MTDIDQIKTELGQIKAELFEIRRNQIEILTILNALYIPVMKEEQRQISMLPPKQQQAIARERRKYKLAALKGAKA